jgi:hypothetical protein
MRLHTLRYGIVALIVLSFGAVGTSGETFTGTGKLVVVQ